jgi:K+-sensing histidine kinase KdpD
MLEEAHRRKGRGTDVVIGWVETHGRVHTAEQIGDLEIVPPREIVYRGATLKEEEFLHGSVTNDLLRKRPGVDVHVIAERDQARRKGRDEAARPEHDRGDHGHTAVQDSSPTKTRQRRSRRGR